MSRQINRRSQYWADVEERMQRAAEREKRVEQLSDEKLAEHLRKGIREFRELLYEAEMKYRRLYK